MNKIRIFLVLLSVIMILSGCSKDEQPRTEILQNSITNNINENKDEIKSIETIKIPYEENDTLNPYTLKTQMNSLITPLIFDGLVKVDVNYKAINCIAREITKQGNIVTVKIKNNAHFSDGSNVTADDVVVSFDMAKKGATKYAYNLKKVTSIKKVSDDTVTFEMSEESKNYKNLFNFPIVKTVSDNVIGSGKYTLSREGVNKVLLKANSNPLYQSTEYPVKKIILTKFDGKSTPSFEINMNEIDLAYDNIELKNDKAVTLPYVLVPTNKLIYIGINSKSGNMANNEFKKAFSYSLDVEKLGVYVSLREDNSANGYLNPQFYKSNTPKQNLIEAKKLLDNLGFRAEKVGEIRKDSENKPVVLKLLVNEENLERKMMAEEIKRQMLDVGIEVEIISEPFNSYKSKLKSNDFDLYIGEIGLADDLDLMPVLKPSGTSGFGANETSASVIEYQKYQKGEISEKELCDMLRSDVPFITIAYSDALLYHKRNFVSYIVATTDDIFYNILNWEIE